ncbi:hypothetical protein [Nocardioides sp. HB32]
MQDDEMHRPIQEWIDDVNDRWRRTGVPAIGRGRLRRELERDVADAVRSGAGTRDLTTSDPDEFADQVARAHGHSSAPAIHQPSLGSVAATTLAGALVGAAVAWFIVWPILLQVLPTASDNAMVAVAYPVAVVVVVLGAAVALRLRFRTHASLRVVASSLIGMAVGCLLALPVTLLIARGLSYPTNLALVLIEALPMLGLAVGGIYLANRLASRRTVAPTAQ